MQTIGDSLSRCFAPRVTTNRLCKSTIRGLERRSCEACISIGTKRTLVRRVGQGEGRPCGSEDSHEAASGTSTGLGRRRAYRAAHLTRPLHMVT